MLDLKYRPLKFQDVLGNTGPVSVLRIRSEKHILLKRSVLLGGPKGSGKTTIARIISRSLVCRNKVDGEPCNECDNCIDLLNEQNPAVFEFDAATQGNVEKIRSIVDDLKYESIDGTPTILILDESHRLSSASQDALLKSMEERRIFAVLCTTEPNKIRSALRDRVDEFAIKYPNSDDMLRFLKKVCNIESIAYEEEALKIIINDSENSPRLCLNHIQSISITSDISLEAVKEHFNYDVINTIRESLSLLTEKKTVAILEISKVLYNESPAFIREMISKIVSNSIRKSFGLSVLNPHLIVNINKSDIPSYVKLVQCLFQVDRITAVEIEMAFWAYSLANEVVVRREIVHDTDIKKHPPLDVSILKSNKVNTPEVRPIKKSQVVEIEGVKFSPEESLTSIDLRVGSTRGIVKDEDEKALVEYDKLKVPLTEQEFERAFIERFKQ